jgi:hypothetical protein
VRHPLPTQSLKLTPFARRSVQKLEDRVSLLQSQLQRTDVPQDGENDLINYDGLSTAPRAIPEAEVGVTISKDSSSLETRLRQNYPVFLYPENSMRSV